MDDKQEFRLGPLSVGDMIALGGVIVVCGVMWADLQVVKKDSDRMALRLQALEQIVPSEYVRRQDYREDVRELKEALTRIEAKLDQKVDK